MLVFHWQKVLGKTYSKKFKLRKYSATVCPVGEFNSKWNLQTTPKRTNVSSHWFVCRRLRLLWLLHVKGIINKRARGNQYFWKILTGIPWRSTCTFLYTCLDASQVSSFIRKKKLHADKLRTVFWNMMIDTIFVNPFSKWT